MNLETISQEIIAGNVFLLFAILVCLAIIIVFSKLLVDGIIRPLFFYNPIGKKTICSDSDADKSKNHTAIIAISYPGWIGYRLWKNTFINSSGVDILKKGLTALGEFSIIYHPSTPEQFMKIIQTKEANPIWIIGHGYNKNSKKGLSFVEGKLPYDAFKALKINFNKDYVMQLQCWGSDDLNEYLCEDPSKSYCTNRIRSFEENRDFIIKTLEKMNRGEF